VLPRPGHYRVRACNPINQSLWFATAARPRLWPQRCGWPERCCWPVPWAFATIHWPLLLHVLYLLYVKLYLPIILFTLCLSTVLFVFVLYYTILYYIIPIYWESFLKNILKSTLKNILKLILKYTFVRQKYLLQYLY
jgi:hypothetical protein